MSSPEVFEVLGGSKIGEKAQMLREHVPLIAEAGLGVPPTTVIAEEALIATPEAETELGSLVARAVRNNGEAPIAAVRSSGEGDARGSGVYDSSFSLNSSVGINGVIRHVLDSFQSDEAEEFRKQAGLGDEFAVMIHPLIGQRLPAALPAYAPALSGFGYSSTAREKDGFINVVAGFGGGLSRQGGERIRPRDIDSSGGRTVSFDELVTSRMSAGHDTVPPSDFRPKKDIHSSNDLRLVNGDAFYLGQDEPVPAPYDIWRHTDGSPLAVAMNLFEPERFIETLQAMEQITGYPLYVEWATTTDGESLSTWVVQIAPVEKHALSAERTGPFKEMYYAAHGVIGSGVKEAQKIVACLDPAGLKHLHEFNADPKNEGYILIYSSDVSTSMSDRRRIDFGDFYRASVVLDWPMNTDSHLIVPIAHHGGAIDLTGKLFGVIDAEKSKEMDELGFRVWKSPNADKKTPGSIRIAEGNFTAAVNEMEDRLIIGTV